MSPSEKQQQIIRFIAGGSVTLFMLAIIVLTMFYGYVLTIAFNPTALGRPVAEGSMLTIGVAVELFMFIFFWVLTAFYVRRANNEFDAMTQDLIRDAWKENK